MCLLWISGFSDFVKISKLLFTSLELCEILLSPRDLIRESPLIWFFINLLVSFWVKSRNGFSNFHNSRIAFIKFFANCFKQFLFRCKPFLPNMLFSMFPLMIISVYNCCSRCATSSTTLDAFLLSCLFIGVEIITFPLGTFNWMNYLKNLSTTCKKKFQDVKVKMILVLLN